MTIVAAPRLLVVDDSEVNLVLIEEILAPLEMMIVTATSGARAIEQLVGGQVFALVLLDVQMPEMDGFATARLIRQQPHGKYVPIVFITAFEADETRIRHGFEAGGIDYLFKPISPSILRAKVNALVQTHLNYERLRLLERESYQRHLAELEHEQQHRQLEQMQRELEFARNIQRSLLPSTLSFTQMNIFANIETAREVGGDFYDVLSTYLGAGDPVVTCAIGDVMGKGMPAAMMVVLAMTVLREGGRFHIEPLRLLGFLNERLNQHLANVQMNNAVTMALIAINANTRVMYYCTAGHEAILHRSAAKQTVQALHTGGLMLGVLDDALLEEQRIQLEHGDKIMLYTDGITEARDAAGDFFGDERLMAVFADQGGKTLEELGSYILQAVAQFRGAEPPHDDVALLLLEML